MQHPEGNILPIVVTFFFFFLHEAQNDIEVLSLQLIFRQNMMSSLPNYKGLTREPVEKGINSEVG